MVCLSLGHDHEPANGDKLTTMPFGIVTRVGPRNRVLDGADISHTWTGNFEDEKRPAQDMTDGDRYIHSDSAGGRTVRCGCRFAVLDGVAHWRNLANTTEPSVHGGDAALRQIILHIFQQDISHDGLPYRLNRRQSKARDCIGCASWLDGY